jgi:ATP-dependent phosphofructokinase / diphosphate-dependent phosphofructokinase
MRRATMKKNALVAQSGGPSPVINASLQGVVEACMDRPDSIGGIFAAWHGIEGVLREELIDMGKVPLEELRLLRHTPASGAIGTCRYKLKASQAPDFDRILEVFRSHDIGYFFYIGGNDSMDTASKVSALAAKRGMDLVVVGVPKTIDNDIGDPEFKIIDHTPGYGSCARYWAYLMQNADEENRAMSVSECVSVYQSMGRASGWITAASRLADPERRMPLQLYMAEAGQNLETLADHVNDELVRSGRCIVVVNEGFDVGEIGVRRDGFGHVEYGASESTASQAVINYLNSHKLKARGQASGQLPGVIQRGVSVYASTVDIEEAYGVGREAVEIGLREGTGWMATILRRPGTAYQAYYDKVDLLAVANSERFIPKSWIAPSGIDVTDDFLRYARPLIGETWPAVRLEGGLQRFARFDIRFVDKRLPSYVPMTLEA